MEYQFKMRKVVRIVCKKCNSRVNESVFKDFYTCDKCKSITNHVNIEVTNCVGLLKVDVI